MPSLTRNHVMFAKIKFQFEALHCWPEATGNRAYLSSPHRHMFHVTVELQVFHHDREVEYHDLLDFCRAKMPGGDLGRMSCEDMATNLMHAINETYPGRQLAIEVMEDGENGAYLLCID